MKTLICYKTKYGATGTYAKWLAEATKADILEYNEVKRHTFDKYDAVVVCSGTYCGLMPLNWFLKRKWNKLKDKKVIVMAVGAAPADDNWSKKSYNRIPARIRENITYIKLMGEDPEMARGKDYKSKVKKENLKPVLEALNNKQ